MVSLSELKHIVFVFSVVHIPAFSAKPRMQFGICMLRLGRSLGAKRVSHCQNPLVGEIGCNTCTQLVLGGFRHSSPDDYDGRSTVAANTVRKVICDLRWQTAI